MAKNIKDAKTPAGQVIYLGPSMQERDASGQTTFQIGYAATYKNGVPADVAARMEADADFKRLFVPVESAPKAMADLGKDTPLAAARAAVAKAYVARQKAGGKK